MIVDLLHQSMFETVLQFLLGISIAGLALMLLNRVIRHSLAAPRVRENDVPKDLLWEEVSIATERGRKLFGWLMPARESARRPAPALAVIHGWGSNAQMMLPLAKPLHEARLQAAIFRRTLSRT